MFTSYVLSGDDHTYDRLQRNIDNDLVDTYSKNQVNVVCYAKDQETNKCIASAWAAMSERKSHSDYKSANAESPFTLEKFLHVTLTYASRLNDDTLWTLVNHVAGGSRARMTEVTDTTPVIITVDMPRVNALKFAGDRYELYSKSDGKRHIIYTAALGSLVTEEPMSTIHPKKKFKRTREDADEGYKEFYKLLNDENRAECKRQSEGADRRFYKGDVKMPDKQLQYDEEVKPRAVFMFPLQSGRRDILIAEIMPFDNAVTDANYQKRMKTFLSCMKTYPEGDCDLEGKIIDSTSTFCKWYGRVGWDHLAPEDDRNILRIQVVV
jgi:hypothetical protein